MNKQELEKQVIAKMQEQIEAQRAQMQENFAKMHEQITKLKNERESPQPPPQDNHPAQDEFFKATDRMSDIFKEAVENHLYKPILASTVIGFCPDENGRLVGGQSTLTSTSIQNFHEEGLATAMDVFSNPRRINIIKNLMAGPLTASEITHKTGLVGGQLYHHLGILENARLIEKSAEKYSAPKSTQLMLGGLFALAGGMQFVKTEEANNGLST